MMFSEKLTTRPSGSGRLLVVLMAALAVGTALLMALAANADARKLPTNGGGKPAPTIPTCTDTLPTGGSTAYAWGWNINGQLGNGTYDDSNSPVGVKNLSGVRTMAGGGGHSLALMDDCTVRAWGENFNGQLGNGANDDSTTPVQVRNLGGVKAISAGQNHGLALKNDGTVWSWGYNFYGQLGDGTTTDRYTPVQILNLSGVKAIAAGGTHSLALKTDGTVFAWGYNAYGQLGSGTFGGFEIPTPTPVQVKGEPPINGQSFLPWDYLSGVKAIDAGMGHSMALMEDGTVRSWGANNNGQLGDGTYTYRNRPAKAQNLSGVTAIASTSNHSLALKTDSTVRAWGSNDSGQLGDVTSVEDRNTPVQVKNLVGVASIAAGGSHSLAKLKPAQSGNGK